MSKRKNERRVGEGSAIARLNMLKASPRKLNLIAGLIRDKHVYDALNALEFCEKRASKAVRELLNSCIANAENNHGLDVDSLYVTEASVGRDKALRRLDIKGRSRRGIINKPFSNMRIVVTELE